MSERMSPAYRAGLIHGAYQAAMPARYRPGFLEPRGWQYRRGFARAFRAARGLPPLERKHAETGRCWCRAYHGHATPAAPNRTDRRIHVTKEPPAQAAAQPPAPLDRARSAIL